VNDAPGDGSAKPVVLIVDDTPENLTIMNGLLKDAYHTKVANSGERALKLAAAQPKPDLVLLDIMMPEVDGLQVLGELKRDDLLRHLPVIMITSLDEDPGFTVNLAVSCNPNSGTVMSTSAVKPGVTTATLIRCGLSRVGISTRRRRSA